MLLFAAIILSFATAFPVVASAHDMAEGVVTGETPEAGTDPTDIPHLGENVMYVSSKRQ